MALQKEFLEKHDDDVIFYRVFSDCGKNILQVETDIVYGEVCITDNDPYTYEEIDTEEDNDEELSFEDIATALEEIL